MTARPGFTLLELLLAVVLTSIVALLVYGTVQAGLDTRERLAERLRGEQSRRAVRAILADALRNARASAGLDDSVFTLETRTSYGGRPSDRLTFLTGGGLAPLTPESDWFVTLQATDSGVTLVAQPVGARLPARLVARLADITGVEVRVLPRGTGTDSTWTATWPNPASLPRAVSIVFWSDSGALTPALRTPLGAQ